MIATVEVLKEGNFLNKGSIYEDELAIRKDGTLYVKGLASDIGISYLKFIKLENEPLEAKSKSCENCRYYNENGACKNESLDSMDKTLEFSDFWFSPTKDFCCNKHEPKIIKALEK